MLVPARAAEHLCPEEVHAVGHRGTHRAKGPKVTEVTQLDVLPTACHIVRQRARGSLFEECIVNCLNLCLHLCTSPSGR